MPGYYTNVSAKRAVVARTQVVTVTDMHGLQRQYVMPDTQVVEPGDVLLLTDAEIATLHGDVFTPAEPL